MYNSRVLLMEIADTGHYSLPLSVGISLYHAVTIKVRTIRTRSFIESEEPLSLRYFSASPLGHHYVQNQWKDRG